MGSKSCLWGVSRVYTVVVLTCHIPCLYLVQPLQYLSHLLLEGDDGHVWDARDFSESTKKILTEGIEIQLGGHCCSYIRVNHPLPGRGSKAPVVWHWQADDETGFCIQMRVSRQMVPDIWEQYTNTQRIYNSLTNDWDICTELDPDAAPETDDWDEGDWTPLLTQFFSQLPLHCLLLLIIPHHPHHSPPHHNTLQ